MDSFSIDWHASDTNPIRWIFPIVSLLIRSADTNVRSDVGNMSDQCPNVQACHVQSFLWTHFSLSTCVCKGIFVFFSQFQAAHQERLT